MPQPEQGLTPEVMQETFRAMLVRMRNYGLHHLGHVDLRTLTMLQDMDLVEDMFDDGPTPMGANIDLEVLRDPNHPRRFPLPPGPLVVYRTADDKPKRIVIELPVLLYSELPEVRGTAFACLEKLIADGALDVTPKTRETLVGSRDAILSDAPQAWHPASIALSDAFRDDVLVALQGARQSLESNPVIQDSLNAFVPRVLHPAISSLDSIRLDVRKPEEEHSVLEEIVASVVREAGSLRDACSSYYARLGYLPLAPAYSMGEVVARWVAAHPGVDAWTEVWNWARGAFGPTPRYHACAVFTSHPELIPDGKFADLWREIMPVLQSTGKKDADAVDHEPWTLRRTLARHFVCHLEASLPDNDGAALACFAWWFAERVAMLFPDNPQSAHFYHTKWVEPAADRSANIRSAGSSRISPSFLRYVTAAMSTPWAAALLGMMGKTFERLDPGGLPADAQTTFNDALVACLISALPVATASLDAPTYAVESGLGETALRWASRLPVEQRQALERLVGTSRALGSVEAVCQALQRLGESPTTEQMVIAFALQAKAYTDPHTAAGVWEILSDADWRQRVLGSVDERVLCLLLEAFSILLENNQDKWFSLLPHYLADLCEKTEDAERRRVLFLMVVHTSLASDTVSAIRRLLRGSQKAKFVDLAKDYRAEVEALWSFYPPWVQGRLRALLASLHVT